ncbi:G-type lectin S-receptor-like serine/threonine-protein kinase [Vitis vinifera]|uniref:G-type lectin S-receptor-like serine/threonine-protein kinase n=1 Tax=Vitis vinifera TaxID=29760 RepID=A0A438GDT4_VITVI|nr:G-type lectin S-receptor-like serine/threonine-protein kinase [Vitis vinifera]
MVIDVMEEHLRSHPGVFSLEHDPNGTSQIFILQGSTRYWTSGAWNGQISAGLVLDVSGQIKQMTWLESFHQWNLFWSQPRTQCEVYAYCGPFGICDDSAIDEFCECLPGFEPASPNNWNSDEGMEWRSSNFATAIHYTSNGQDFYLKLAAPEPNGRGNKFRECVKQQVEGMANCYTGHFPNLTLCHLGDMEKAPKKSSKDTNYELSEANKLWRGENKEVDLPMFSFASVSAATNNFSIENKLGEGDFGPVYKGKSQKGYKVAMKRLSKRSGQGWELKNEALLIAKLQHKNLVKLFGYCIEQDEKILIYEYMPNKSLDFFLFDPAKHGILNWKTWVHIIEGVAQGLLYPHQYSRLRIIHRDLKASNILLDKDMNPKISDFGMARIFGSNESKATNHIVGTYGYMSPEYALEGLFSTKSDVFSFGVLLLEILSGKKNTGFYQSDSLNLLGYVSMGSVERQQMTGVDGSSVGRDIAKTHSVEVHQYRPSLCSRKCR